MIVFVNAISVTEGGPLVVLQRLLEELIPLRKDVIWHVAVNKRFPALHAFNALGITTWVIPGDRSSLLGVEHWYEWGLPRLLKRVGADVLFSVTNYLPRRQIATPSLLLVQHAGHFSPLFKELTEQCYPAFWTRLAWRAKSAWVRESVRRASLTVVQTHALARAVMEEARIPAGSIAVVPHGPGLNAIGTACRYPAARPWRIGYITKYGVQKNFLVLFKAVKTLLDRGHDVRLVLTLHVDAREYQWVARYIQQTGIEPCVENHGDLAQDTIEALYDTLHLFVFPSLCESFGFPMVEAMARGLPIAIADTESNREIAADGAAYFDAEDDEALAACLEEFMGDSDAYESAAARSISRAAGFSWQAAARGTMECLERIARVQALVPAMRASTQGSFQARTRLHYDAYPLDFLSAENERLIAEQQPVPFREFVESCMTPGQCVADVGCGPGRATMYLAQKGMEVCAVDISVASLGLARNRAPGAHYVCATNLALPMPDRSFDVVVSDGVIHHTPDAARSFRENARLVKARGYMYLGVYRRHRYYYYIYTYLGIPVRWVSRWKWGTWLLNATLLPAYYLVHLVKSKGERTWAGAKNFLYDYIVTPQATFHTYEEVEGWARAAGMLVVGYEENVGNVHAFVLRKK